MKNSKHWLATLTVAMLSTICLSAAIEIELGTYKYFSETHKILFQKSAGNPNDPFVPQYERLSIGTLVLGGDFKDNPRGHIEIEGKQSIETFRKEIIEIGKKYFQWVEAAKKNGVKDFQKPIPLSLSPVKVSWFIESQSGSKEKVSFIPKFQVKTDKDGKTSYQLECSSETLVFNKKEFWLTFLLDDEGNIALRDFVRWVDYESMKKAMTEKERESDLFK